jgi:hypothetical protein
MVLPLETCSIPFCFTYFCNSDRVLSFCPSCHRSWVSYLCFPCSWDVPSWLVLLVEVGVFLTFCLGWPWTVVLPNLCLLCSWDLAWRVYFLCIPIWLSFKLVQFFVSASWLLQNKSLLSRYKIWVILTLFSGIPITLEQICTFKISVIVNTT